LIKDVFVLGINDNKVRENLLKEPNLNLKSAICIARASEKAKAQASVIFNRQSDTVMKVQQE